MTTTGGQGSSFLNIKMSDILCFLPSTPKYKVKKTLKLLKLEVIMVESLKIKTMKKIDEHDISYDLSFPITLRHNRVL